MLEEHLIKAQLVFKIDTIMKDRGLKQVEAAISLAFASGDFIQDAARWSFGSSLWNGFCVFSSALDQDVDIVIKPHRDRKTSRALHVS